MATLGLEQVVKDYPGSVRAVDDVTLQAADGELMVLVGPSGCGKTTILRLVAGLESVTRGTIRIGGQVVNRLPPKDRNVAMVFQNSALYPHLTVAGNLAFGLKLRKVNRAEIARRVVGTAEVLGIGRLLKRRPGELSGGQRQRVALGRAIVRKPKVFLFDEPLSNLDAALRGQMQGEIRRLHARLATTMLYVTHDQTEAMTLGQRIAVLYEGRIQQVGDPPTLYNRPANCVVAGMLGSPPMNFLDGRVGQRDGGLVFRCAPAASGAESSQSAIPIPGQWTARFEPYVDRPITMGIRPEHLLLPSGEDVSDAVQIAARVEAVEVLGREAHVQLLAAGHKCLSCVSAALGPRVGDDISCAVSPANLHFFDPETGKALS